MTQRYYQYVPVVGSRDDNDSWMMQTETAAGIEPLTLLEAKSHLKIADGYTTEDTDIQRKLTAARQDCESGWQRTIRATVSREVTLKALPDVFWLPYPPLLSVEEVAYRDEDGAETAIDSAEYRIVTADIGKGYVEFKAPTSVISAESIAAYVIRYTAGYADASSVPAILKEAILLSLDILYDNDLSDGETANLFNARKNLMDGYDPGVYR